MSRCTLCDKRCTDQELKLDKVGWARLEPACRRCLSTITTLDNNIHKYDEIFVPATLLDDDSLDDLNEPLKEGDY